MQIVVPMAGEGLRFKEAGYEEDKPFIEVDGVPMIDLVLSKLPEGNLFLICREEHLPRIEHIDAVKIVVDETTGGAASSVLLAKEYINNRTDLLIANSDQLVEYSAINWNAVRRRKDTAGIVWVFPNPRKDPKWSFVKLSVFGDVIEVAEKNPISIYATCGLYYWTEGSLYVQYAERMIRRNLRVNGEFYNCPVYQQAIEDGILVLPFEVDKMQGLGTPEDLHDYEDR